MIEEWQLRLWRFKSYHLEQVVKIEKEIARLRERIALLDIMELEATGKGGKK